MRLLTVDFRHLLLAVLLLPGPWLSSTAVAAAGFEAAVAALETRNFRDKAAAVAALEATGDARAKPVLTALLNAALYVRKDDGRIVILTDKGGAAHAEDAVSGAALGSVDKSALRKIPINNQLRVALRGALARLGLRTGLPEERIAATYALLGGLDAATVAMLRDVAEAETSPAVRRALVTVIAAADLADADAAVRLRAIGDVSASMHAEVRNRLARMTERDAEGNPHETDVAVRMAAAQAIRDIDARRARYQFIETVFFGLSLGFVLVLAATGLAITFGVMGVINMAHGELMMLGAYTTWCVQQLMPNAIEWSIAVAIPSAFVVTALVGIAIERGVVRFLYGRPLETLLTTFGLSLVLQQAVRSIFSPLNRAIATPDWMSGQWVINESLAFTLNRLCIIVFSAGVFALLICILRYSRLGLQIRAVAQNREMARAMGVRSSWVDAATFGLGAGVAGLAGVALSQLTNVGPNLGQAYIVDSFMVVVFGGVGNLWGTLVAGLSLGVANKFLEPFAGAVLAKIVVLVFIVAFIQRWPRGLFPQRGRAAEG